MPFPPQSCNLCLVRAYNRDGLVLATHPIASPINPIAPVLHPTVVGRAVRAGALLDVTKSLDPGRLARRQGRIALQEVFSP